MKSFNVLEKDLNIHRNYMLEASAGTGKTFSIENIVVRLLIEGEKPVLLPQILVVTFTTAATSDLKERIRDNIEKAKTSLSGYIETPSPYLQAIIDTGDFKKNLALDRLDQALLIFDQANILTIHSFCAKILSENVFESDISTSFNFQETAASIRVSRQVICDFFRTQITEKNFSKEQVARVLKSYGGDLKKLEDGLLHLLLKGVKLAHVPGFSEQLELFKKAMVRLKKKGWSEGSIIEKFYSSVPDFKGICNRQKQVKPEILQRVEFFASLFKKDKWGKQDLNALIDNGLVFLEIFSEKNAKKNQIPEFVSEVKQELFSFVDPTLVFAKMAYHCQQMLEDYSAQEEIFNFDDLLKTMRKAIENKEFVKTIRANFSSVIIDEFQDTDPIQWQIFSTLFPPEDRSWGNIYLVGDPKQSIYAFRQADIYTYLRAVKQMGGDSLASLDTNYRSQPSLVRGLNKLFKSQVCQNFLELPKIEKSLDCPEVRYSSEKQEYTFSDEIGSVHFVSIDENTIGGYNLEKMEEDYFFPFITQEIQKLKSKEGISYKGFAVLVADRFQSQRMSQFLKRYKVPSIEQKAKLLTDTEAFTSLKELIEGVLHYKNPSFLKKAMGGKIIGWTHQMMIDFDQGRLFEKGVIQFKNLRSILIQEGVAVFFERLMQMSFFENNLTVQENILFQTEGYEFFCDLNQTVEALLSLQDAYKNSAHGLVNFLKALQTSSIEEEERLKKMIDPDLDAVNIMTLHASKGLEFDIVFTLGLIKRSKDKEEMIPVDQEGKNLLVVASQASSEQVLGYKKELDAEKMRQLYVGMTRAKKRLYNPVFLPEKELSNKTASAIEIYLTKIGSLEKVVGPEITHEKLDGKEFLLKEALDSEKPSLINPKKVIVPGEKKGLYSFTSLANHQKNISRITDAPHDFSNPIKTAFTLPSGSQTGNILHKLLEKVRLPTEQELFSATLGTDFEGWEEVLFEIVENALKTSLGRGFCLLDVGADNFFAETEFLYSKDKLGYVKGFVDLFFYHQGKYYLLDWKSNWLGRSADCYQENNLTTAMKDNQYLLQVSLYKEALKRYLKVFDQCDFDQIFGGVYYLFLRGLSFKDDKGYGIWYSS